jgi:hypothetical protein
MEYAFSTRSRFVPPLFFGDGSAVEPGDLIETSLADVRVRVAVERIDGDAIEGVIRELQDESGKREQYDGLAVGGRVTLRLEHVRSCWKAAAA